MKLSIQHQDEMRFIAITDQHKVTIDLPVPHGGTNQGMTPPQLFVASLGACIGVYVVDYCEENGISYQDLSINVDWALDLNPKRIKRIHINLELPNQVLSELNKRQLIEAANSCMLHNTLGNKPQIVLSIPEVVCEVT